MHACGRLSRARCCSVSCVLGILCRGEDARAAEQVPPTPPGQGQAAQAPAPQQQEEDRRLLSKTWARLDFETILRSLQPSFTKLQAQADCMQALHCPAGRFVGLPGCDCVGQPACCCSARASWCCMSVLGAISLHSVDNILPTSHWPPWSAIASIGSGSMHPRAESRDSMHHVQGPC